MMNRMCDKPRRDVTMYRSKYGILYIWDGHQDVSPEDVGDAEVVVSDMRQVEYILADMWFYRKDVCGAIEHGWTVETSISQRQWEEHYEKL